VRAGVEHESTQTAATAQGHATLIGAQTRGSPPPHGDVVGILIEATCPFVQVEKLFRRDDACVQRTKSVLTPTLSNGRRANPVFGSMP
jgi:hypothetical protein